MRSLVNVRLAEARKTKRLVSGELGIDPATLWRWSTDRYVGTMCLRDAERLARCLGCRVADLFEE